MQSNLLRTYTARHMKTGSEVASGSELLEVLEAIQIDSKRRYGHSQAYFEYMIEEVDATGERPPVKRQADEWYDRTLRLQRVPHRKSKERA